MQVEEWRPVPGYPGYHVSSLGRVRSSRKILKVLDCGHGYMSVHLGRHNKRYVHRLVAETFLVNPDNLPIVNHLNSDRRDNRASNLEWCTYQQNSDHASRSGRFPVGDRHHGSRLSREQVREIRGLCLAGVTKTEVGRRFGISDTSVSNILTGRTYRHVD